MSWDDFRFVLALEEAGSLAKAAKVLRVDHTTVGRRVAAAEEALGVRLFTRSPTGFVPTKDAERLLAPMKQVEEAVLRLQRAAAQDDRLEGPLRVTSPETFGTHYLAARLAAFGLQHPGLRLDLLPAGDVLDLGRGEAEVAVRGFRSRQEELLVRRGGILGYGLYAAPDYLARHPFDPKRGLGDHAWLSSPEPQAIEARWLERLVGATKPSFTSISSLALRAVARQAAGIAVLPHYLARHDPRLTHLPMPDEPSETLWLTVHRDLARTPRVRALLNFLAASMKADASRLRGR
ncbi:MAG: LysR family transcriptional regulator [Polyangiaceae bacterium]